MKFKTTAIAMAVAGTVAAPVAVQAGADEVYASARIGLNYRDTGGTSDFDVGQYNSRLGAKGETDLGNGLTGFGRFEWDVDFEDGDSFNLRHRYAGLKGDFGSVWIGQTNQTFYNFVVGPNDNPFWHSGDVMIQYVGRTDNAISYAGSSDAFAYGATAHFFRDEEEEAIDIFEAGASFTFGNDMTLAGATRQVMGDEDDAGAILINSSDEAVYGLAFHGIMLGDASMGFGYQMQDDDYSVIADLGFNNFYAHVEYSFVDEDSPINGSGDDVEPVGFTLGYTQSLGRKTTMNYEAFVLDADSDDDDDDVTEVMAVLQYDII